MILRTEITLGLMTVLVVFLIASLWSARSHPSPHASRAVTEAGASG